MDIQSLTQNPMIKNLLLKQLKKAIVENGITAVIIYPDETGELDFKSFTEPVKVITEKSYQTLINKLLENE